MQQKESQNIEFKKIWKNDYLKVIAAFANGKGGELYLGIADNGKKVGLKDIKILLENIPNIIRNNLGIIPSIELINDDVIKIIISPSFTPISYKGKFYLRSGSTTQELTGKLLSDFLIKKSGRSWDSIEEQTYNLNEISLETIETFKKDAKDKIPAISYESDNKRLLQKLNLIGNSNNLKRAVLLLFFKNPQKYFNQAIVKIGKFLSESEMEITDIIKGNIFNQIENVMGILKSKYLNTTIKYDGLRRIELLEYPFDALREAIINAIIHRDYSGTSHIQIKVFSNKMVIINQGKLPPEIPLEKLKTNHLSIPKNPLLAEIFYYAGYIESWGQGTIKILDICQKAGLPEPDFSNDEGMFTVTFYKNYLSKENLKKIGLNERQINAVQYLLLNDSISNEKYQEINKVSKRTTTRDFKTLIEKNIIKKLGKTGKGTEYILIGATKGPKGP